MNNADHPTKLFDQLIGRLESGSVEETLFVLAGALDGVVAGGGDIGHWRDCLTVHPLGQEIARPGTQKRADGFTEKLGFARALQSRKELMLEHIRQAEKQAKLIRFYDAASFDLAGQPWVNTQQLGYGADILIAVGIADHHAADDLAGTLRQMSGDLAPGGSILISSFVPGHLGLGWQLICEGRQLHCHDETALEVAASQAGLILTHFRDASDCLVWAVLRQSSENTIEKGEE